MMTHPATEDVTGEIALELCDLRKVYAGVVALAGASMSIRSGEVHGLLGANGAGKSTIIRLVAGAVAQDHGTIRVFSQQLPVPHDAAALRRFQLGVIHQDPGLILDLSIAENMSMLVGYPRKGRLSRRIDWAEVRRTAVEALQRLGVEHNVNDLAGTLSVADQAIVSIARALALNARLLLLDEPTANLGVEETARLHQVMRRLRDDGVTQLLVTHALDEALELCDRVSIIRDGSIVGTFASSELTTAHVAHLMLGYDVAGREPAAPVRPPGQAAPGQPAPGQPAPGQPAPGQAAPERETALALDGLVGELLRKASFGVRQGEIVGVTGLADSGHLDLPGLLAGVQPMAGGQMTVCGEPYEPKNPHDALRRGVGLVPSDRAGDGLASGMSLRENLFLNPAAKQSVRRRPENVSARRLLAASGVKPADPDAEISTLSGGNQQKILVSRWLAKGLRLLVLAEPTIGVDVGARSQIYDQIREQRGHGLAVLVVSSDFDEIAALADRAIVMRGGYIAEELDRSEITVGRLTRSCHGVG
jgi:ABC-type sugar transport system ATPase subunit